MKTKAITGTAPATLYSALFCWRSIAFAAIFLPCLVPLSMAASVAVDYRRAAAERAVAFVTQAKPPANPDDATAQNTFLQQTTYLAKNTAFKTVFQQAVDLAVQMITKDGSSADTPADAEGVQGIIVDSLPAPAIASGGGTKSSATDGGAGGGAQTPKLVKSVPGMPPTPEKKTDNSQPATATKNEANTSAPSPTAQTSPTPESAPPTGSPAAPKPLPTPPAPPTDTPDLAVYNVTSKGYRTYISEGARVLTPYTITAANNILTFSPASPTLKGFVQFNIDSTWAWLPDRERNRFPAATFGGYSTKLSQYYAQYGIPPSASDDPTKNDRLRADGTDPQRFDWALPDWRSEGWDTRFNLGFNFANGTTPSASTVTSGGDIYAEAVLEKILLRGLLDHDDLDNAYSVNLVFDGAANTDRQNLAIHSIFLVGADAVLGWQLPITDGKTVPERGLFRLSVGYGRFDNVVVSPPGSTTITSTNGTTPTFAYTEGWATKAELMYPISQGMWVSLGGYEVLSGVKPPAWTFYIGTTLSPADFTKLFTPKPTSSTGSP